MAVLPTKQKPSQWDAMSAMPGPAGMAAGGAQATLPFSKTALAQLAKLIAKNPRLQAILGGADEAVDAVGAAPGQMNLPFEDAIEGAGGALARVAQGGGDLVRQGTQALARRVPPGALARTGEVIDVVGGKVGGGMSALKKAILGVGAAGAGLGAGAMMMGEDDPRHLSEMVGPRQDIALKPEKPIRRAIRKKSAAAKVAPATEALGTTGDYFGPLKYSFGDFPSEELRNPAPPVLNSINLAPGAAPEASPEFAGNLTPEQKKNLLLRALTLGLKG